MSKERYQEIESKTEQLRDWLSSHRLAAEFLERLEMSWIYHDNALEGVVYSPQELTAALFPDRARGEASMMPVILELRNHKAAVDYVRQEAEATRKQPQLDLATIKRVHDLFCGNTPELQAARAAMERREKTEKEKEKEKERSGYRKDMPLHRTYFHEIAQPGKIQPQLEKLVDQTNTAEFKEFDPLKQAAVFHHGFMQIFPFTEHSGRVGRMCMNLLLMRNGFYPCILHSIDRQRYYEALRGPSSGFRSLLLDAMENSLDNALRFFREQSRKYRAIN